MKKIIVVLVCCLMLGSGLRAAEQELPVSSPSGRLELVVKVDQGIGWTLYYEKEVVSSSPGMALHLEEYGVLGAQPRLKTIHLQNHRDLVSSPFYKKAEIEEAYNELRLDFRGDYSVVFRMYDQGMAYRFETRLKGEVKVVNETLAFDFPKAEKAWVPYIRESIYRYQASHESPYTIQTLEEMYADSLVILPFLVEQKSGVKVVITEADLEDYPGFFLKVNAARDGFVGELSPYPLEEEPGGHNNLQSIVTRYADYLAVTQGKRSYPWRVFAVSGDDAELLNNDLVYLLAAPSRIADTSWIKPGKVAWDWWNDWNISGVDFRAGINTETYKYYIDFAAQYKIENILLDEGWANSLDIMEIIPEIDLQAIIDYAKSKGVGVWLWGGWYPLDNKTDEAFSTYSKMGVKGFKVDFMNRDDQKMVNFYYRLAQKAAQYNLMLDFHGAYKPTGLQRTYPNVVNFEGVKGMENTKWSDPDFPKYDCTIPFIRQLAGPMDYTPGAMKNANKHNFRAVHSAPMSQGTRCHQLAMYVLFEAPFNMLADNPTNYMREPESTRFIASIPTVFDETIALDGKVAEFAAVARRKGSDWFVGAITNWDARTITIDFSFLTPGQTYKAEIFRDGINADREATDYKREVVEVISTTKLKVNLSTGGGWAAKISK